MEINIDYLKRLLDKIKTMGFLERIFNWKNVKQLLVDAVADLQKLVTNNDFLKEQNTAYGSTISGLSKDLELRNGEIIVKQSEINNLNSIIQKNNTLIAEYIKDLSEKNTTIKNLKDINTKLDTTNQLLTQKNSDLQRERDALKEQNTQFLTEEESRKQNYNKDIAVLNSTIQRIQDGKKEEDEEKRQSEIQRLANLKLTWSNHQEEVKRTIKTICNKHTIRYVDTVEFKGDPDNTLEIANEFVVFDAKSPAGEDLSNFPTYLREQAIAAKKYTKVENVKKWIFFVVPSNTYEVLKTYVYNMGDYDVFIVTLNSLEPIILSLKKIEDYDFAEQLSPEERESICRVLGKFAHLSKRRIQVDYYFIRQFIELAYKAESDLPSDILAEVKSFEKADILNPPQERRAKATPTVDLDNESAKLKSEAETQDILVREDILSTHIDKLPLYKSDMKG